MSGLAMPGGDPGVLEALAARLEAAATGARHLGSSTRQVTASIRLGADWTGDAADAYTAFTGSLSDGTAAAQAPLERIGLAVRDYADCLRVAQQKVADYRSATLTAQVSGNDAGYLTAAEMAGRDAEAAIAAWQAAGDRAAAEVGAATGDLNQVFGRHGPVQGWLDRQPISSDTLAGLPRLGDPIGPEILKTPPGDMGPEILITPPGDQGPEILITPPGDMGPEILITPPGDQGPEILKTPPGWLGPLINYDEQNPNPELPPGYTPSPGLRGDPYNPDVVNLRSELWQQWVNYQNGSAARRLIRARQGPPEIARIDRPRPDIPGSQWHAQGPGEGSPGLNMDGTPHDGDPNWPERVLAWLRQFGWDV